MTGFYTRKKSLIPSPDRPSRTSPTDLQIRDSIKSPITKILRVRYFDGPFDAHGNPTGNEVKISSPVKWDCSVLGGIAFAPTGSTTTNAVGKVQASQVTVTAKESGSNFIASLKVDISPTQFGIRASKNTS